MRDFFAAADDLFWLEQFGVFRFEDARQGMLRGLQLFDILAIAVGGDQFVVAAVEEGEQGVEELSGLGGLDVVLETEILELAAQQNVEVFAGERSEIETGALEQSEAVGVERLGLELTGDFGAELGFDALPEFAGGIFGEGDGENLSRLRMALLDEVDDAFDQHRGFAGARAGNDEHRSVNVLDGFLLLRVEVEGGQGNSG